MSEQLLEQQERKRLIDIVANLYDFTQNTRERRVFIQETAGLGQFILSINLEGSSRTVVSDLVGRLERYGELPERPTYHSLGALLDAILGLSDVSPENKKFLAYLIVRYSLIANPAYLESLRGQYDIAETEIRRQPRIDIIPPRIRTGEGFRNPEFEVQVADEQALERIINSEDNFLDIHLLQGALYCAQAVGRIEIQGTPQGTGFLIGPNLLLTNQHVLKSKDYLEETAVRFRYVLDSSRIESSGKIVQVQPDFYFSSPEDKLDYALVRLKEKPLEDITVSNEQRTMSMTELALIGKHRGYLQLAPRKLIENSRVNIIQHPNGQPLKVVMTQNYIVYGTDLRVQYVADTMSGSSGSPVFNQKWEVIALHHSGSPYPPESLINIAKRVSKGRFKVNEGIPMRAILEDFKKNDLYRYLPQG